MAEILSTIRSNRQDFWQRNQWFIGFFVIALTLDTMTTVYFMELHSVQDEIHPVVRGFSLLFGGIIGPFIGSLYKAAAGTLVAVYLKKLAPVIFVAAGATYLFAAFYNVFAIDLYTSGYVRWLPF
jgi:hypothetical protein